MRLLIVEDELEVAQRISAACASDGLNCHIAERGSEALEMIQLYDYAAIMLDILLPDICGLEVLSRLRSINNNTPVLILSGLATSEDKVKSLSMGADDYITKPFDKPELLARIYAIIRRSSGYASSIISAGPIEVDLKRRKVSVNGIEMTLTSKEYAILELLTIKKGSVLPKEMFLNHIYGGMDEPELKIVDVFICKLRKKIAQMGGGNNVIDTVWGRGYTIRDKSEALDKSHFSNIQSINNLKVS